jgi:hypothetical protein
MKKLLKALLIIGSIFYLGNVNGAIAETPFKDCSDVWGVVGEFCDVQTLTVLAQVSSKVAADPKRQLQVIKEWKHRSGVLVAMFGNPTKEDSEFFRKIPGKYQNFDACAYQDVLDLLTGFARGRLTPEELTALSANMKDKIQKHSQLTATDREVLSWFMPDKSVLELSEKLGNGYLSGECQCEARFLTDQSNRFRTCVCFRRLSDSDLRRITPRILNGADQIESSGPLITLYMAHIDKNFKAVFMPMRYSNSELRTLLVQSLKPELDSNRLTGSDRVKLSSLFMLLGYWSEADTALLQVVEESNTVSDYVSMRILYALYQNVTKPIIRTGKVLCWPGIKSGIVKNP